MYKALILSLVILSSEANACDDLLAYMPTSLAKHSTCEDGLLTASYGKRKIRQVAIQYISGDANFKLPFHRDFIPENEPLLDKAQSLNLDIGNLASEKINNIELKERFKSRNLILMPPTFNRKGGMWHSLEEHEVMLAKKLGGLLSISGVYHDEHYSEQTFFKILVQPSIESSISFMVSPYREDDKVEEVITTIACIEAATNLNFKIPGIEEIEESSAAYNGVILTHGANNQGCKY